MKTLFNRFKLIIQNYLKNRREVLELLEREEERERQREKALSKLGLKKKGYLEE